MSIFTCYTNCRSNEKETLFNRLISPRNCRATGRLRQLMDTHTTMALQNGHRTELVERPEKGVLDHQFLCAGNGKQQVHELLLA